MKFKKIVSLILACALTFNSSVVSFASAEKETSPAPKVNNVESLLKLSEIEKQALKAKVEKLIKENKQLKEKVEKLKEQIENLKNKNTESSDISDGNDSASSKIKETIIEIFFELALGIPLLLILIPFFGGLAASYFYLVGTCLLFSLGLVGITAVISIFA